MTIDPDKQKDKPLAMEQALQQAVAQHNAGQLQEAMELYQAILQDDSKHPTANHNMGIAFVQLEKYAESLPYFMAALDADPSRGQYWLGYIDALFKDGQLEAAQQILALARQQGLEGDDVEVLAQRLKAGVPLTGPASAEVRQAPDEALSVVSPKQKLGKPVPQPKKNPTSHEINALVALFNQGKITEAASLAQTMSVRFPHNGIVWKMLGVVFSHLGRNADALLPMQKAAELLPNDAEAHNNLGITLQDLGRLEEAIASFQRAIRINPKFAEPHSNLGSVLQALGRLGEAEASFHRALKIQPNHAEAHNKLGNILKNSGRTEEAEASFRRALKIDPDLPEALNNLGSTLKMTERTDEAEALFRRAILIKPGLAEAHSNLGSILYDLGRLDEAEICYRRAIQHKPDLAEAYSNLLFCLSQNERQDAEKLFSEHLGFAKQFEAPFLATRPRCTNLRDPERCLQVGFVSGDLRDHAVAYFIELVMIHLSGSPRLSLHAYYNHVINDSVTQRMCGYFAHWHPIAGLSDAALAEQIRTDHIDILIDLSGHSAKNRLLAFARKPAPLQASWMGYPGTTGMDAMDYFFSDRFLLPPGQFDSQFTEKIVQLPASAPFLPSKDAPPVNALPALGNGYVTFGSFNRLSKLSREVIALWAQLMRAIPDSRMVLGGMPENGKYDMLLEWFAQEGIARERLDFHPRSGMGDYLNLHHQVDICLDTFPYNGGTTTLHALWMGVPTLTLAGSTAAGRSGAAVLGHVGLEAFVAHDAADFVQKGLYWAGNPTALSAIRAELRERFAQSAIGHPEWVAAGLERALRIMWQRWCAGLSTASFEVTRQEITDATQEAGK